MSIVVRWVDRVEPMLDRIGLSVTISGLLIQNPSLWMGIVVEFRYLCIGVPLEIIMESIREKLSFDYV